MFSLLTEPQPRLLASFFSFSSRYNRTCRVWQTCSQFWQLCRSVSRGIASGHERPKASEESALDVVRRTLGVPWHIVDVRKSGLNLVRLKILPLVFPISIQFVRPSCKTPVRNTGLLQKLCMQWRGCGLWPLTLSVRNDKRRRKKISHLHFPFQHSARTKKVVIIWLLPI